MNIPKQIGVWMCKVGLHQYRVIEVKFGFGGAGKVEVVKCERCKAVATRPGK